MRRKRWAPTATDRELLTEHLFYEVQMTFFLAGQLDAPTGSRVDASLRNAQIESFAMHLRQLVYFFWGENPSARDGRRAFAADYFEGDDWVRVRPELPPILRKAVQERIGVARLAYDERWIHPVEKIWDLVSQAFALGPVVVQFAESVEHTQLTPGYANGMRICAELFMSGEQSRRRATG